MTDTGISEFLKLRDLIDERYREAAQKATLAAKDIHSAEAVQANETLMKWEELRRKSEDLLSRPIALLPVWPGRS